MPEGEAEKRKKARRPRRRKGIFASVEEAMEAVRQGRVVILLDDEDRENEGDLTLAAEKVTPEAINFMTKHGRGLVCLSLTGQRLDELGLPLMVQENRSLFGTNFCVSIDARHSVTTGISAADRAHTILTAINPKTRPEDLVSPGHIFPLRAVDGGVLRRAGQTEGAVDLARLAGLYPAGVICEVMRDDGTMARVPDLVKVAKRHGLLLVTIKDLIAYRMHHERLVERAEEVNFPTRFGEFRAISYENLLNGDCHLAIVKGEIRRDVPTLVRVHSCCVTGDVFGSLRCDCGEQLHKALEMIDEAGRGVVLYLNQEGRGIGLKNKMRAYHLQDRGLDTVQANEQLGFKPDLRDYGIGAQILVDLGLGQIRVMTNNPRKIVGLEGYGLHLVERVPIETRPQKNNIRYLRAKRRKLGHLLANL
ncbi:MAG: bifunctional 3,4-dihydroxy-2-butanone-4-phosphate synthase/GTP cyclohydrolase II [Nitrospinota bacterium]